LTNIPVLFAVLLVMVKPFTKGNKALVMLTEFDRMEVTVKLEVEERWEGRL